MKKEEDKIEEAISLFDSGFNCCQAVFTPFAREHGLTEQASLMITSGFGAGMSYHGETCGAVVGAHLVIGMLNGNSNPFDSESKEKTKDLISQYREKFNAKNGSCVCKDLLGANPEIPEELQHLKNNNVFAIHCPRFVKDSVMMLNEIIEKGKTSI